MGKAAIVIIPLIMVGGVAALVFTFVAAGRWLDKPAKAPKAVRQTAALADEAMVIFKDLMIINSLDGDMDILSEKSKDKIKAWAEKYRKVNS